MKLSDELRDALASRPADEPLTLTDERTNTTYVLLRADVYARRTGEAPPAEPPPFEVPEGIRRSRAALVRDLPELLRQRKLRGRWVAYHGEERVGIARDEVSLVRECLRRGLAEDSYYIGIISPAELIEEEEVDRTFCEFEDDDTPTSPDGGER